MATILREADVNSGSLYHFFPTKESLLIGVLERYQRLLRPIVMDPVEKVTDDPIGRVFVLLDWYRSGMLRAQCKLGCPIGNLALELADNHPDVRRLADANFIGWTEAVKQWLIDAGDRLPSHINRGELAQMVLNTMEGGIMQSRARGEVAPFDAAVRQLRHYFDYLERDAKGAPPDATRQPKRSNRSRRSRRRT